MKYKPLTQIKVIADIQMDFRPIGRSGVLLNNKASGRKGNNDYIYIVLRRGYVIFRYVTKLIDHFTVVAVLPGLWLEARLPVTLF